MGNPIEEMVLIKKTIKGANDGVFKLETPRDRNGTFFLLCAG